MNYSEPLSQQVFIFIRAFGSGFIIGVIYDLIFTLRSLISSKKSAIIFQDILFGIISSVFSFFFMVLFNNGIVRLNLIIAEALGAVVFHFALGKGISSAIIGVGDSIRKIVKTIFYPVVWLEKKTTQIFVGVKEKISSGITKLRNKKIKKGLTPSECEAELPE